MGNIKKGPDGMNSMRPEGLPMLDEMGLPLRVDMREVLLVPMMDEFGKCPQMENG
jgi:hypothetical protein